MSWSTLISSCILFCVQFTIVFSIANSELQNLIKLIEDNTKRAYNGIPRTDAYEHAPKTADYEEFGTFDHIIVGAGSAGCVIANRLTEDKFRNVLLLEAGDKAPPIVEIPAMFGILSGLENNWNYTSVPQTTSCLGAQNRQCAYPRGKGLGGSSLINGLFYIRGNKADYNLWCQQGNTGWCYDELLPLFKKSENFSHGNQEYRGKDGYLSVEYYKLISPLATTFIDSYKEMGRNLIDFNGESQDGCGITQLTTLNGRRHSTDKAFLRPVLHRKNLHILTNSFVIKILIDNHKKAFGVLFSKDKKLYVAKSRQDIIMSAGTIGSAQILMLSGVGPANHLNEMGIPVIQNLPVGENVEDHPYLSNLRFTTNYTEISPTSEQMAFQFLKGTGIYTNSINAQVFSFERTKNLSYPDLEVVIVPPPNGNEVTPKLFNFNDETYESIRIIDGIPSNFIIYIILLHPKSKGNIRLQSANPFDYPLIDPQMLSDSENEDIETIFQGIQLALQLMNTDAFKKVNARLKYQPHPKCLKYDYLSQKFWYCQIRHLTLSIYHIVGSCKMGRNPNEAVVNPELKVFGIDNLRVADASVMPSSISGHTNAATVMIGEKLAELIRNK